MKTKMKTVLMALLAVVLFTQCNEDDTINPNELPQEAQVFLETYYPNQSYTAEKDYEGGADVYEVEIVGGVEVEFDAQGKCTYVGGRTTEVPDEVIADNIHTYVSTNYPSAVIVEWEIENTYQEVELSNNIELIFDLENNFLYGRHDDNDDDETIIGSSELPAAAQTFLTTHFPDVAISVVTKETEQSITEYEVTLSNAFELDFDATGNCISIDGNKQQIPDSALNSSIVDYVNSNYAMSFITDWDLDSRDQEVELLNGVDLVFDLDGNFRYAD